MAKTETRSWDPAEHLETEEDVVAYLNTALEDGDLGLTMAALGDIARARGMTTVAQDAGLGRESFYRSLSHRGNPRFATVLKLVRALGLRLHAATAAAGPNHPKDSPRFRRRRDSRLMDVVRPFESQPSSRHVRDAMSTIERLRDDGRRLWQDDSDELDRWNEGCTEMWVFLNTLGRRRDGEKQPLETAFREFVQAFEHTVYRMKQMLHGLKGQGEGDSPEVDSVFGWIELVYRLSTYGLVSFWIDDKTEEKTVHMRINLSTSKPSGKTEVVREMTVPRKYRSSARLGQPG